MNTNENSNNQSLIDPISNSPIKPKKPKVPLTIRVYLILLTIAILFLLSFSIILKLITNKKQNLSPTIKNEHQNYAILVAFTNTWTNYRHQSDIYRAYNILSNNGINKNNIITFAYDDLAYHASNKFQGKIFNKPTNSLTDDVYEKVKNNIDYKGNNVSVTSILNSISGEKSLFFPAKVLESNENDNVFIFISGHGGVGFLKMHDGSKLYADSLNKAIREAYNKKLFSKMIIYVEACESGSLFDGFLSNDGPVYAVTAANSSNPSYATFCPYNSDIINGAHLGTCLSDAFANEWMSDTELYSSYKNYDWSLRDQWTNIEHKIKRSYPQVFGNKDLQDLSILNFQANRTYIESSDNVDEFDYHRKANLNEYSNKMFLGNHDKEETDISSNDSLISLEYQLLLLKEEREKSLIKLSTNEMLRDNKNNNDTNTDISVNLNDTSLNIDNFDFNFNIEIISHLEKLNKVTSQINNVEKEIKQEVFLKGIFDSFFVKFNEKLNFIEEKIPSLIASEIDYECYKDIIDYLENECYGLNDYSLKYTKYLAYSCRNYSSNFIKNEIKEISEVVCVS